jgi:hypothetical protein
MTLPKLALRPLTLAAAFALPATAHAQFGIITYDVTHQFNWLPPAGATVMPTVILYTFQHAWVRDHIGYEAWAVLPAGQLLDFDGLGTDLPSGFGAVNMPTNSPIPVPCIFGVFTVPNQPAGYTFGHCLQVISPNANTFANACIGADIAPWGVGTLVRGRIQSAGSAGVTWGGRAYAFSSTAISIVDATSTGTAQWAPFIDSVAGAAFSQVIRRDPIVLEVTATDGTSIRSTLLDIDYAATGPDSIRWANGILTIDAQRATFRAAILAPGATNPGEFFIEIDNGSVVNAHSNGSLGFPVPPLGTATPFTMPLPNNLSVDYDATAVSPNPIQSVRLDMGGAGSSPTAGSPCGSADFDGDGDIGTDADIEAFFACLAGNCCDTCFPGGADFNGDGDIGTDADIESFFRVLAGGPC